MCCRQEGMREERFVGFPGREKLNGGGKQKKSVVGVGNVGRGKKNFLSFFFQVG